MRSEHIAPRRVGWRVPLVCGHLRRIIFNDPGALTTPLWCDECDRTVPQTAYPNPAQLYELATDRAERARALVSAARVQLDQAEAEERAALGGLALLETRPGIPAHTQAGGTRMIGRTVFLVTDDQPAPLAGKIVSVRTDGEWVMVQWDPNRDAVAHPLDELRPTSGEAW